MVCSTFVLHIDSSSSERAPVAVYEIVERRLSGSAVTSCDKRTVCPGTALGLNYKAGTAGAELPYKAAIAFDDPRLGRPLGSARPQFADVRQAVAQKKVGGWTRWSSSYLAKVKVSMILDIVSKLQLGWCPIPQLLWWSLVN